MTDKQEELFKVRTSLMKAWKMAQDLSRNPEKADNLSLHNLRLKLKDLDARIYNLQDDTICEASLLKISGEMSVR